MIKINMLPWREQARGIKKKNFFVGLAISIGITMFIILLFHIYYNDLIARQDQRNLFLQGQISERQEAINKLREKKEQQKIIENKLQFIIGLREKSYRAIRLLNELLRIVPDTITLGKLFRDGTAITIEGKAQSELAITAFMKSLSQSTVFSQPVLTGITSAGGSEVGTERYFQLKVEQKK